MQQECVVVKSGTMEPAGLWCRCGRWLKEGLRQVDAGVDRAEGLKAGIVWFRRCLCS